MQQLTKVSHRHHDLLWEDVRQLGDLAECLDCDCLDSARLLAQLPQMRDVSRGLTVHLLPHMQAVEAAVFPTLVRLAADHGSTIPMAGEHREIERLMAAFAAFADRPPAHVDRVTVLSLRRAMVRLHALLRTHLAEESLYIPILEDRLTGPEEAALARALDHLSSEPV